MGRGNEGALEGLWRGHQGALQYKLGEEAIKGDEEAIEGRWRGQKGLYNIN